jgi:hypothetical protein
MQVPDQAPEVTAALLDSLLSKGQVVAAQANTLMRISRPIPGVNTNATSGGWAAGGQAAGTAGHESTRSLLQTCPTFKTGFITRQTLQAADMQRLWGLDRIDQPDLPLSSTYQYSSTAASNVAVYVIDTGIQVRVVSAARQPATCTQISPDYALVLAIPACC